MHSERIVGVWHGARRSWKSSSSLSNNYEEAKSQLKYKESSGLTPIHLHRSIRSIQGCRPWASIMIRSNASKSPSLRNRGNPATDRLRTWYTYPPGVPRARLGMSQLYHTAAFLVNIN